MQYRETTPCGHLSNAVIYDIVVSRGRSQNICQYAIFILAPAEWSLVNMDNGHYYAVPTACKHIINATRY